MRAPFKRRLSDVDDKTVFYIAFFCGLAVIMSVRLLGDLYFFPSIASNRISAADWLAIIIAVSVIYAYFQYICFTKDRSGVSVDRASDNVYYLGLLFTLVSLAYSLIKLSASGLPTSGLVLSLLPDFGLGLFSTIAGILFRILLQQMRNDPMDVETQVREELGVAVHELRGKIGQVIADLNGLSAQMNVTLTEMGTAVSKNLEQTAAQNAELIKSAAENIGGLGSKFNNLTTEMGNSVESLKVVFSDDGLRRIPGLITTTEKQLEQISQRIGDKGQELETTLGTVSSQLENLNSTAQMVKEHSGNIESSVNSVDRATTEFVDELGKATEVLRKETDKV